MSCAYSGVLQWDIGGNIKQPAGIFSFSFRKVDKPAFQKSNMKIKNFQKTEKIIFSQFDTKNNVKIPKLNSELLAYETGVHIGDGSLQLIPGSTHSVRYYGNREEDWIFVSEILPNIVKKLFNKNVIAKKYPDKCVLAVCSKAVATFKQNIIGLPNGNKIQIKDLPIFIKKDRKLLINCLRGIADTDFGFYFDMNGYPTMICTMNNKPLIKDISKQLMKLGLNPKTKFDIKRTRNGKINTEHCIKIYGKKNTEKWMEIIGFWNPKHLTKYLIWKHIGFSKNRTTLKQRLLMLKKYDISFNPKRRPRRW